AGRRLERRAAPRAMVGAIRAIASQRARRLRSLSPFFRGEKVGVRGPSASALFAEAPLTPTLSPQERGEGAQTQSSVACRTPMTEPRRDTHFGFRTVDLDAKQGMVDDVFRSVARRYDLMNDLMSGGLHRAWKDALVTAVNPPRGEQPFRLIDVAGGTGDIAFRVVAAGRWEAPPPRHCARPNPSSAAAPRPPPARRRHPPAAADRADLP